MSRATKAERDHMGRVAALGCLICGSPAEVHHVKYGFCHRDHLNTIPLCSLHHRHGKFGECVENGKKTFCDKHGSEQALLEITRKLLAIDDEL